MSHVFWAPRSARARKGGAAARNKGLAFTLVLDREVRAIMLFPVRKRNSKKL